MWRNRGLGVCGMRWRIHGRFARRVPDVPAVEQRFACRFYSWFRRFHEACLRCCFVGGLKFPGRFDSVGVLKKFHYCFPIIELVLVASLCFITSF